MGQSKDQEADDRLIKGQWLASVAQRVSSEDLADLMDLARVLDEGARFGRLTDELDL